MMSLDQTAQPSDRKQINLELSEQTARYVLDLPQADGYAHSPTDHEAAKLRYSIEVQLLRAKRRRRLEIQ